MNALTTAVVPANVIRQVFTEALERLEVTWDERMEGYKALARHEADMEKLEWQQYDALCAARKAVHAATEGAKDWTRASYFAQPLMPSWSPFCMSQEKMQAMRQTRAYYTLMLYTIETNAVVHMTQEQIQRMQQVDAENKAARKDGVS